MTQRTITLGHTRRGFALALVLWAVAIVGALGLTVNEEVRTAVAASHNRVQLSRARWLAEACASQALAHVDSLLAEVSSPPASDKTWWMLDSSSVWRTIKQCSVELRAGPGGANINSADSAQLSRLFEAAGMELRQTVDVVSELLRAREGDSTRTVHRLESPYDLYHFSSYRAASPLIRDNIEKSVTTGDALFSMLNGAERGFAALPGVGAEAVLQLRVMRSDVYHELTAGNSEAPIAHLQPSAVAARLYGAPRDTLLAHLGELAQQVAPGPTSWLILINVPAVADHGTSMYQLILKLVRANRRAVVVERTTWP